MFVVSRTRIWHQKAVPEYGTREASTIMCNRDGKQNRFDGIICFILVCFCLPSNMGNCFGHDKSMALASEVKSRDLANLYME